MEVSELINLVRLAALPTAVLKYSEPVHPPTVMRTVVPYEPNIAFSQKAPASNPCPIELRTRPSPRIRKQMGEKLNVRLRARA